MSKGEVIGNNRRNFRIAYLSSHSLLEQGEQGMIKEELKNQQ